MMCSILTARLLFIIVVTNAHQKQATAFLKDYNSRISALGFRQRDDAWMKATNITAHNNMVYVNSSVEFSALMKQFRINASSIVMDNVGADSKRQFKLLLSTMASSNQQIVKNVSAVGSIMKDIYSKGKIHFVSSIIKSINISDGTTYLTFNKHLSQVMAKSRDTKELLYVWKGWRDAVGPQLKNKYKEFVRLSNVGAREHKCKDAGDYKRKKYEVDNLQEIAETFWNELKPFYEEVHAFVRHRLTRIYPNLVKEAEPIPAHLLGNMWAQTWENIFPLVTPYPGKVISCYITFAFLFLNCKQNM